jgi:ribosome modulation factor
MEQWNMSPPPLSLWSRSDWAKRHSEIAKSMGHLPSENAFSGQREVADGLSVPTAGHVETDDVEGAGFPSASVLEQLLSDTYHDPTSSLGDYWNDTNGRSRQPCNYETPGRSDPTYAHLLEMGVRSDMSISLSETDCERQDQASSISNHGDTDSQACNAVGSALAEEPTVAADGNYWNDTNGRSRQPCNYETLGRSDPTYAHLLEMGVRSDMSISLSETDCERQDQASSISKHGDNDSQAFNAVGSALAEEPAAAADCDDMSISLSETDCERLQASSISKHRDTDSQACNAVARALAEEPAAAADCDEVTSAAGPYHEDSSQAGGHAAAVQYWKMEDSPILEEGELSDAPPADRTAAGTQHQMREDTTPPEVTPEADSPCGQPESRPAARHNARTLPPRNTFPGLRFRQGCNTSRQFLSQGMGQSVVHQGPSNGWIEDDD